MELEEEGALISVTLVKPGSIDTPLFDKARTILGVEPQPVPPVYAPELVARAILHCAERPVLDVVVSGMGKVLSLAGTVAPRLTDRYMERSTFESQASRGRNWKGRVHPRSIQTAAALHPAVTAGVATALVFAGLAAVAVRNRG